MHRPQIFTDRPDEDGPAGGWPAWAARRRPAAFRVAAAAASAAAVLALAGACGSDDTATPAAPAAPAAPASAAASASPTSMWPGAGGTRTAAAAATTVMVTESEFTIKLSQNTFTPGMYTFATKNSGGATHALEIEGPGLNEAATAKLGPGESENLTVTLQRGTYKLYCPVGNHEAQGMKLEITVA